MIVVVDFRVYFLTIFVVFLRLSEFVSKMNKAILAVALLGLVVLATVEAGYPLKEKRMRKEKASIAKEVRSI